MLVDPGVSCMGFHPLTVLRSAGEASKAAKLASADPGDEEYTEPNEAAKLRA